MKRGFCKECGSRAYEKRSMKDGLCPPCFVKTVNIKDYLNERCQLNYRYEDGSLRDNDIYTIFGTESNSHVKLYCEGRVLLCVHICCVDVIVPENRGTTVFGALKSPGNS